MNSPDISPTASSAYSPEIALAIKKHGYSGSCAVPENISLSQPAGVGFCGLLKKIFWNPQAALGKKAEAAQGSNKQKAVVEDPAGLTGLARVRAAFARGKK